MAMADYYLCDVCGRKTFYDAELYYEMDNGNNWFLHGVGDMKVICEDCAKTNRIVIEEYVPEVKE